MKQKKRWAK